MNCGGAFLIVGVHFQKKKKSNFETFSCSSLTASKCSTCLEKNNVGLIKYLMLQLEGEAD